MPDKPKRTTLLSEADVAFSCVAYLVQWETYLWTEESDEPTRRAPSLTRQRTFSEPQFDLALAEFIKQANNPRNDRVELITDATGKFLA